MTVDGREIQNEFDTLGSVVIHNPDIGIGYISPDVAEQLLYDDIVFMPRMVEEHQIFSKVLRTLIHGMNVLEFEDLLADVLKIPEERELLLSELNKAEHFSKEIVAQIKTFEPLELSQVLISGMDFNSKAWIKPIPNLVFTRDLGCVINGHLLISKMKKEARRRESFLFKSIVRAHPLFRRFQGKIIDSSDEEKVSRKISLEGGDLMIVHPDYLLVGISERTSWEAFCWLKEKLFELDIVKNIISVKLPNERYCMHLDTVFTIVNEKTCVGYAPLVFEKNGALDVLKFTKDVSGYFSYSSLADLIKEVYPAMTFIPCGGGKAPFDAREQWTDGANLFAINNLVCLSYERNVHTLNAFRDIGFHVIDAKHLLQMSEDERKRSLDQSTIVTVPSAELSRARGGPHCMTFPMYRYVGNSK